MATVEFPMNEITAFCRRHQIRELALFGSVLRDDFTPESDIDLLVDFEPGAKIGFMTLSGMQIELSELLQRPVDLVPRRDLKKVIRDTVLSSAKVIMRSEKLYLTDIVEAADAIQRFVADVEQDDFLHDELYQSAVLQKLTIIGEAAARLSNEFKSRYPEIEWRKIVGFRNIVVHTYFAVDYSIVWVAATQDAPDLRDQIALILEQEFGSTQ
jgi:uncharacterized protein with HEPN domain